MLTLEEKERIFFDAKINFEGQFDSDFLMKLLFGKAIPDHAISDENLRSSTLHVAVLSKDCTSALIQSILAEDPSMLNQKNIFQVSPLHRAVYCATNLDIVTELLKHGAHVNAVESSMMSALHIAARNNYQYQYDLLQILIEYGGDVNCVDLRNQTPLHMLLKNRAVQEQSLYLLLQNGANPNACDKDGNTILKVAIENQYTSLNVIKILLMFGASPENELKCCFDKIPIAKLFIQYIAIKSIETVLECNEAAPFATVDLSSCSDISIYLELSSFKDNCIHELFLMTKIKLNQNYTLFKFITEHCSNARIRDIDKNMSLLEDALLSLKYPFTYCSALIDASFELQDILSILSEHGMYADISETSSGSNRIYLNYYMISNLASYLAKIDLINLAIAYMNENKQRNQTKKKMCLSKSTKRIGEMLSDSMIRMKRLKL